MLKPIGNNIVLQVEEQDTVTSGGIVIPGAALDKPFKGKVVAANASYYQPDGTLRTAETAVGDSVYFGKTHGTEIKHHGETFLVISEEFILCKE